MMVGCAGVGGSSGALVGQGSADADSIRGRVVDPSGIGVEGALVIFRTPDSVMTWAVTDEVGYFELACRGLRGRVEVHKPGYRHDGVVYDCRVQSADAELVLENVDEPLSGHSEEGPPQSGGLGASGGLGESGEPPD